MHFDRMATTYADARPPYPEDMYAELTRHGVIGPGMRILEVGAGSGLATRELIAVGCEVVAIESGARLAGLLRVDLPGVQVLPTTLEASLLGAASFSSAVAATSMHWVDLQVGLPKLHDALRSGGQLAVWRHVFGDPERPTEFRDRVRRIVASRGPSAPVRPEEPPSMTELADGGWFSPVRTFRWHWSIDLTPDQVGRLFATFSDWSPEEVAAVAGAAAELGDLVTEHYQTVLHLLRKG